MKHSFLLIAAALIGIFALATITTASVPALARNPRASSSSSAAGTSYSVNISDVGPRFDGIGAISGGGATSVLLWTYAEPSRSRILDYLFKPNFGASLPMLKVEIGGGGDSTDGAELSTEQLPGKLERNPGYEIWLMKEAKKRNPRIQLYGLAWTWPAWITCSDFPSGCQSSGKNSPYVLINNTISYLMNYIDILASHGLFLDYIGIWNERPADATFIKALYKALAANNNSRSTKITAPDGFDAFSEFSQQVSSDAELSAALYSIGAHYPGTESGPVAQATGKQLWASEDDSTYNSAIAGAGCLARIINQNYVNGDMTLTIVWNLIASYQKGTKWYRAGMMTALKPWGNGTYGTLRAGATAETDTFSAGPMLWVAAHTTQFSQIGWRYVRKQQNSTASSGKLAQGGSFVTLVAGDEDAAGHHNFTIVIEKMSRDASPCVRPFTPMFAVSAEQKVRFTIANAPASVAALQLWRTCFNILPSEGLTEEFVLQPPLPIQRDASDGSRYVELESIDVDCMYTLTTLSTGNKGSFGETAASQQPEDIFPRSVTNNFDLQTVGSNARWWSDQNGGFMVVENDAGAGDHHKHVLRQVSPAKPVTWGNDVRPHTFIGHIDMVSATLSVSVRLATKASGVVLGMRARNDDSSIGVFLAVDALSQPQRYGIWTNVAQIPDMGTNGASLSGTLPVAIQPGAWARFHVTITQDNLFSVSLNNAMIVKELDVNSLGFLNFVPASGYALIGTKMYGGGVNFTDFVDVKLDEIEFAPCVPRKQQQQHQNKKTAATVVPAVGSKICNVECSSEVGIQRNSIWDFNVFPNGRRGDGSTVPANQSSGVITLRSNPGEKLCISAAPLSSSSDNERKKKKQKQRRHRRSPLFQLGGNEAKDEEEPLWLHLAKCNNSDPLQLWSWFWDGVAPDMERQSVIYLTANNNQRLCIDVYQQRSDILCAQLDAWECGPGNLQENQAFFYDANSGEIANEATVTCVGVC